MSSDGRGGTRDRLSAGAFPLVLRTHQQAAIDAYGRASDPARCHLVLPPGSGKTLIGAEIARQIGRPVVVLTPNTAIQGQWAALWRSMSSPGGEPLLVTEDRSLSGDVTVLTYQAIATFDDDAAGSGEAGLQTDRLHPDAADLLDRLATGPAFTLVLDEAHHLAQTWGVLLAELLARLQGGRPPVVIALTATPRSRLTQQHADLTDELFGPVLFSVGTPALVRDSVLAPFRELVRFVEPSQQEQRYLAASATRWRELTTSLLEPGFASVDFLAYLDAAWVRRQGGDQSDPGDPAVSWRQVERQYPDIARAVLRLHAGSGLVELPRGARLTEEHRQPPDTEDWVELIADYGRRSLSDSPDPRDQAAWERLRAGLRSVGWTLTRTGPRRGQSPVDRVLQRTVAKADAAAQIVQHEELVRGDTLRAVVITDFERASATPVADLRHVLAPQAGSAWEALAAIDAVSPNLEPVLVTGRVVAGRPSTMTALRKSVTADAPELGAGLTVTVQDDWALLTGPGWTPRTWVPAVTRWFLAGGTRVLIGTRGLLGEGWDAASITTLIDLTAATTTTSVVQVRGRAIRRDPADPEKAAHIWSVVAVSDSHPRGDLDYRRFVTKHDGFHAADPGGRIVLGVSHVSARCGPFHPPVALERSEINAEMLAAAELVAEVPGLWGIGQPYEGVDAAVVRIVGSRGAEPQLDVPEAKVRRWQRVRGIYPALVGVAGGAVPLLVGASPVVAVAGAGAGAAGGYLADRGLRRRSTERAIRGLGPDDTLLAIGTAVAAALAGESGSDLSDAVVVAPDPEGVWRAQLLVADAYLAGEFAAALEQVLAPIDWPRYLVSRDLPDRRAQIWHAVPAFAGVNRQRADRFHEAWVRYVSASELVYTGSPEGAGVLAAVRGLNPLDVATAVRIEWR